MKISQGNGIKNALNKGYSTILQFVRTQFSMIDKNCVSYNPPSFSVEMHQSSHYTL